MEGAPAGPGRDHAGRVAQQAEKTLAGATVFNWTTLEPVEVAPPTGAALIRGTTSDHRHDPRGRGHPRDLYRAFKTALQGITALRLEAVTFDELPRGGPGRDPQGGFVVSEMAIKDAAGRRIALRNASASTPSTASFTPAAAIDGHASSGGWALLAADGQDHRLVVETVEPLGRGEETALTLELDQNAGQGRTLGRFRLSATTDARPARADAGPAVTKEIVGIAAKAPAERSDEDKDTLARFYRRVAPELEPVRQAVRAADLRKAELLQGIPQSLITSTQPPDPVRILPRGNWLDESGEVVEPAVPHFLPQIEVEGRRATRLDLARWLTSPENPLTARVFVNRQWEMFFGHGLARTPEDLGSQGEWPTHTELLDWLAVEFVESGWDVKRLVRTLVTSATYRQTSRAPADLVERDPDNRLYARQARFRIDAEMVRDNALAVSGLLSTRMGGPGVHPYQPRGYWAYLNFPPREWDDAPARTSTAARCTRGGSARFRSPAWPPSTRPHARSAWSSARGPTSPSRRSRSSTIRPTWRPRASSRSTSCGRAGRPSRAGCAGPSSARSAAPPGGAHPGRAPAEHRAHRADPRTRSASCMPGGPAATAWT
jgi:hypothetical protein